MNNTKKLVLSGLLVAAGLVLPFAFHGIPGAGGIFLPMHLPVLLCGLVCGPFYGLGCGILTPLLSSLITGMPPAAVLPGMVCELAVYGLVSGLLYGCLCKKGNRVAGLYLSLILAMLAGRATYGVLNALIFKAGAYSFQLWLSAAFITSLPGILIQLVVLPAIVLALERSGLLGRRASC